METIIGLLFILLPVIFKLIGKKFEQSGHADRADKMKELAKVFGGDGESDEDIVESDDDDQIIEVRPVEVKPVAAKPAPVMTQTAPARPVQEVVRRSVTSKKPILMEEGASVKKEKIDPKKLVIYSEIMKPKF